MGGFYERLVGTVNYSSIGIWRKDPGSQSSSSNQESAQQTPKSTLPLECDSGRENEMTQDGEQLKESEEITLNTLRPSCLAAIKAREQMQRLLSSK